LIGTTGSARELAGAYLATEHVFNEISAHAAGAAHFDADVDTIFEIGGQDAKTSAPRTTFTIALLKRMYQHLVDRDDKGAALRQAKLDLLKEGGLLVFPTHHCCGLKTELLPQSCVGLCHQVTGFVDRLLFVN